MATTTTFLTMPIMRDIVVIGTPTSNANDAKANLADFNLDTTWTPSSTANQIISFDTQPPGPSPVPTQINAVSGFGLWLQNNDTDFSVSTGSGMTVRAAFGDTGSSWTGASAFIDFEPNGGNIFWATFTEVTHRFWQFEFRTLSGTLPIVSQLFFLTTRTLNATPEFPKRDEPLFHNNLANLTGGRKKVSAQALNSQQIFDRNFTLINNAEKTTLENVYKDNQGSLLPFIYQEGTNVEDSFICRLQQEKPDIQEIDFAYHKANMKFEQLPYILDGKSL